MTPSEKIIHDLLPKNSLIQAYKFHIINCMEEQMIEILKDLHTFGLLNVTIVKRLTKSTGFDCKKLCEDHGITYNI